MPAESDHAPRARSASVEVRRAYRPANRPSDWSGPVHGPHDNQTLPGVPGPPPPDAVRPRCPRYVQALFEELYCPPRGTSIIAVFPLALRRAIHEKKRAGRRPQHRVFYTDALSAPRFIAASAQRRHLIIGVCQLAPAMSKDCATAPKDLPQRRPLSDEPISARPPHMPTAAKGGPRSRSFCSPAGPASCFCPLWRINQCPPAMTRTLSGCHGFGG